MLAQSTELNHCLKLWFTNWKLTESLPKNVFKSTCKLVNRDIKSNVC